MNLWKRARLIGCLLVMLSLLGAAAWTTTMAEVSHCVVVDGSRHLWIATARKGKDDYLRSLDPFEGIYYAWKWQRPRRN